MIAPASAAAAQAALEYGLSSSSGLGALGARLGNLASSVLSDLDRLASFALAHPGPTVLVAALVVVAVVVRSTLLR